MSWLTKIASNVTPTDIINAFVIRSIFSHHRNQIEGHDLTVLKYEAELLKEKIVTVFTGILRSQIAKYLESSSRIIDNTDQWLKTYPDASVSELAMMLETATTRSPAHGRAKNENWGKIAYKVAELEVASDPMSIVSALTDQAGLFNLIHNSGTTVLDKLPNYSPLLQALNTAHNTRNPSDLLSQASPELARVARQYYRI